MLLNTDPIRAWLDAGIDQVRSPEAAAAADGSSADFTTSREFVEDFRVHKVLDWLQHRHWRYIRSDRRLLHVQVRRSRPQPEPQTLHRGCVLRLRSCDSVTVVFGLGQQAVLAANTAAAVNAGAAVVVVAAVAGQTAGCLCLPTCMHACCCP